MRVVSATSAIRMAALVAVATLSACVAETGPRASQQDIDRTGNDWFRCMYDATGLLDDKTSDASVVAVAVRNYCEREAQAFHSLVVEGMQFEDREAYLRVASQRDVEVALNAVLRRRATR